MRERDGREQEPERKASGQPAPRREGGDEERADDAADAHRGVQPAEGGVAAVQQPQREHDEQHLERSVDDRLGAAQPDHDAQRGPVDDGRESGRQLGQEVGPLGRARAAGRAAPGGRTPPTRE